MLDMTVDLTPATHVRVTGCIADNQPDYYALLLFVSRTLPSGHEVGVYVRNRQGYMRDVAPSEALASLLTGACEQVGVADCRFALAQLQDALRGWLAREAA